MQEANLIQEAKFVQEPDQAEKNAVSGTAKHVEARKQETAEESEIQQVRSPPATVQDQHTNKPQGKPQTHDPNITRPLPRPPLLRPHHLPQHQHSPSHRERKLPALHPALQPRNPALRPHRRKSPPLIFPAHIPPAEPQDRGLGVRKPASAYADEGLCEEEWDGGVYEFERGECGGVGDVGGGVEGEWGGGFEDGVVSFLLLLLLVSFFLRPFFVLSTGLLRFT